MASTGFPGAICSTRPEGRGLPKTIAGFAIGIEPMIRKSMSPPPSRIVAPAAAIRSRSRII
jgi:hypothetical protein